MKPLLVSILLLHCLTARSQLMKSVTIGADTTKFYNTNNSGNQLMILNGTENRTNSYLKNKGGGLTEFNYAVDSVWFFNDTLFVLRDRLHKFKINGTVDSANNGITNLNGILKLGGNLDGNTSINLRGNTYTIKKDSANFTNINPSNFFSQRSENHLNTSIEQNGNLLKLAAGNIDSGNTHLEMNKNALGLYYTKSNLLISGISMDDSSIQMNSPSYYFNGNWVKMPSANQLKIASTQAPEGSMAYNTGTKSMSVSNGQNMNPISWEYFDSSTMATTLPTAWANSIGNNIPMIRIRHPKNVTGSINGISPDQDFKIMPYEYGMAVEYNGVLENWVGEFSIHRGFNYYDMGDGGSGWGGVFWVGDDNDYGGLRMTARNNIPNGGNIKFTEISSEQFNQSSAGNLRIRLVDSSDRIDFIRGSRGSNNVYSYISESGIKMPETINLSQQTGTKGLMLFDKSDSTMKYFNGKDWKKMQAATGSFEINGNINLAYEASQIQYINASNSNIIITLPTIVSGNSGLQFKFIRTDASSHTVTINSSSASDNSINGTGSVNISIPFECINLYSNGIGKWIATKEAAL